MDSIRSLLDDNIYLSFLQQYPYAISLTVLVTILLITRLISTLASAPKLQNDGTSKTPPSVPYWIPIFGHIPNMAIDADGFVKSLRSIYRDGIFTLNFGGSRHNVMFTPGLATAMLNQKSTNADNEGVTNRLMQLVFGFPKEEQATYDAMLPELQAAYKHIQVDPWLGDMVDQTARKARENVQNLVTGMESPVDQMPWEKVSNIKIIERPDGERVAEASLLPLIRDFCAFSANPSLMGPDFLENNPKFFDDIWTLDRGFLLLATGLPRYAPIPSLTRAHIARRNNVRTLEDFHRVLEQHWNGEKVDAKWSGCDDVSALLKARMEIYRKYNVSIRARASIEHALMWAANANSNALIFWMINHIYEDRALLAMIRDEIAPYVQVRQEETGLPISEPPRITKFDVEGLCNNCPLLKSCYVECLRVDTGSWSFKTVRQDFVLQSREKGAQPWLLKKGDYAHVAHDLHNTDPAYWNDPLVWKPDRHIKYDDKKVGSADMGSIRPYGESS